MLRSFFLWICLVFQVIVFQPFAQAPEKFTSSDIHQGIQKLNVLGSVLYVAAHPDDENTRMISYFSNARKMETTYLSLTRGDGGQNLIGPEIKELLGVIRTQELLAARRIDGGHQLFSRAVDFGYSKSPLETMEIWDKNEVLADVVYTMRKVQPDIVINRFSNDLESRTHGHHTASAVLSTEAFDLSHDSNAFPDQLNHVTPWQPKRLFWNTSWWFYGSREAFEQADKSNMVAVNAGVYYPEKGKSNGEIAAESRSMHKCQGMGSTASRGNQMEYLELLSGKALASGADPFEGIDITWNRVKHGGHIAHLVDQVERAFDHGNPAASIPGLIGIKHEIEKLADSKWKRIKLGEVEELIFFCAGLYMEAIADDFSANPGEEVGVTLELIKQSGAEVSFASLGTAPAGSRIDSSFVLPDNEGLRLPVQLTIPATTAYSNAYWLDKPQATGMYRVDDQLLRGLPETPHKTYLSVQLTIEGAHIVRQVPVVYKNTDPVKGEVYRPFEVIPRISVAPAGSVYVFADDQAREITFTLEAGTDDFEGVVRLQPAGRGWKVEPASREVHLGRKGEKTVVRFQVTPPSYQDESEIRAIVSHNGTEYSDEVIHITYDHIPTQAILAPAVSKIVRVNLAKSGNRIGYIMGAGDEIPQSLEQVGYEVTMLETEELTLDQLKSFDAIILGIRAFNTNPGLKFKNQVLFDYAYQGGNVIVQYNTSRGLVTREIAPYPLTLSRDRVSLETAEVRFLQPDHPVLSEPNEITADDFSDWVQERGLYFAGEWAPEFEPILSSNDPGEPPRDGGLLIGKHGEGYYIYTGYSWFRELPAGVPGAFRLFTNLISLGHRNRS